MEDGWIIDDFLVFVKELKKAEINKKQKEINVGD